ncbi:DNA damage-inducible protein 1 [Penicillium argentinense]|uniref:RING-type E3 ubiquitin transferase n=1 Tax=Penicillium argentinense TaxID=1131581 RepID=A0A9W9KAC8_9EURO|nr:DNA damage-inducible protein 1 [Penicillium argentinense]KAJ5098878.1 DNA damage-inducible protein 1 [Penicillium argentinense]
MHLTQADALPVSESDIIARAVSATSGAGLTQPEKITLYVVSAIGGIAIILGVAILILRTRHYKRYPNKSRHQTRSILKTIPVVQYDGEESYPNSRSSSIVDSDDFAVEKMKKVRNTTCSICTEDFAKNQILRVLPCDHQYHMACIQDWLFRSWSCPVCRIELKPPMQESPAKDIGSTDVEKAMINGDQKHALKLHSRLLRHLYSVGLGQHYNSA